MVSWSSPGRSFLAPKSRVLAGLVREAQKRETGSIRSEEISEVDLEGSGLDSGILGFRVFT